MPAGLAKFYEQIGEVVWSGFACSENILSVECQVPVAEFAHLFDPPPPDDLFVFGYGIGGDMLVYSPMGEAGWMTHESGYIYSLGTIEAAIEWVFGEACERRSPDTWTLRQ